MKRLLLFFLAAGFCTAVHAVTYPGIEQVVTKLYANYSVREMSATEEIHYEKKREGWYVVYREYNDTLEKFVAKQRQLYWSVASGKYKILTMFPAGVTAYSFDRVRHDLANLGSYDYARCPYYGYEGWDVDVMTDFERYDGTNDTIYEGLGRAYANFAKGYTFHQYSYHLAAQQQLPENERVDRYIEYQKKALAVYDSLRKRRPLYETMVGTIDTKYCNEVMATYDELLYYGREGEMNSYLKQDLYDPFMLGIARNMLESCGANGILFTNGDGDSYPLWYLQWIKGVRTDVAVMNISLMNTGHYLRRFRDGFRNVPAVQMNIPQSIYDRQDYFRRGDEDGTKRFTAKSFLQDKIYVKENSDEIYFTPGTIVVRSAKPLPAEYNLLAEDSAVVSLDRYYLYQGDMALLDVTLSNFETRPVYATITTGTLSVLDDYFFTEGLVKRFIPGVGKENTSEMSWMGHVASTEVFRSNMMKLLSSDTTCKDPVNGARWRTNIKISALYAADLLATSEPQQAKALLAALYRFCPYTRIEAVDVYALDAYYRAGDQKTGDALGTALLNYLEKELSRLSAKRGASLTVDERSDRERMNSALVMAKDAFDKYERPALEGRAASLIDRF